MKRVILFSFIISALALMAPGSVLAAFLLINDSAPLESVTFNISGFENGFLFDGIPVLQPDHIIAPETIDGVPIVHTFSGSWNDLGQTTPVWAVVAFAEPGMNPLLGVSDILTFTYFTIDRTGFLEGSFVSDPEGLLTFPPRATVFTPRRFDFSNTFITAQAIWDGPEPTTAAAQAILAVPQPATLVLVGAALLGFGLLRSVARRIGRSVGFLDTRRRVTGMASAAIRSTARFARHMSPTASQSRHRIGG
jgi:hypothetical protein